MMGSFGFRDKDAKDSSLTDDKDRIIINKIGSSSKRPHLQYWFYAGGNEETADRDKDGTTDVIGDTQDIINLIKRNVSASDNKLIWKKKMEPTIIIHGVMFFRNF